MMALILKDLMIIQRQLKSQTAFLALLLFMAIFMQQGAMLFAFIIFITMMQTITALTYDELSNWDKYAQTLPITKSDIVNSKYMLGTVLIVIGLTIALPFAFVINSFSTSSTMADFLLAFSLLTGAAFCILALLVPVYIKFGSIKGRFVLIFIMFVPSTLIGMFSESFESILPTLIKFKDFGYFAPFVGLIILWLSSIIATGIYKKKDF